MHNTINDPRFAPDTLHKRRLGFARLIGIWGISLYCTACPREGELAGTFCGDGVLDAVEQCDDGNTESGDGCAPDCLAEPFCGDGVVDAAEECDDGNTESGDGCEEQCRIEPGFACSNTGAPCEAI